MGREASSESKALRQAGAKENGGKPPFGSAQDKPYDKGDLAIGGEARPKDLARHVKTNRAFRAYIDLMDAADCHPPAYACRPLGSAGRLAFAEGEAM